MFQLGDGSSWTNLRPCLHQLNQSSILQDDPASDHYTATQRLHTSGIHMAPPFQNLALSRTAATPEQSSRGQAGETLLAYFQAWGEPGRATPWELAYGRRPDVTFLRIFGCEALSGQIAFRRNVYFNEKFFPSRPNNRINRPLLPPGSGFHKTASHPPFEKWPCELTT